MTKATFERIECFIYIMHYHQFKFSYDIKALSNPMYTFDHLLRLEKSPVVHGSSNPSPITTV